MRYRVLDDEAKGGPMRSFIAACIAAIVLAVISAVALNQLQEPASVAFSTASVRL